jgi:zinc protease
MKITKFQLKNGATALIIPSHKSPVVSAQVWVHNGSADESKGEEGISHFIEHLLFKGIAKYKSGEIAKTVEGHGGELNAYTSFDQTVYYINLPSESVEVACDCLSQMIGFPQFDPAEIEPEREVVVEELKRGLDLLGRVASQNFFSLAYTKHPYGVPVIGFENRIRKWSPKKIQSYFRERYSPKNFFIVLSGDISAEKAKFLIKEKFENIPMFPIKKKLRRKEPSQKKCRVKLVKNKFEQSIYYIGFQIPNQNHKDIAALELLSMYLGYGDSSLLTKNLRLNEPLAMSAGSGLFTAKDTGQFIIQFQCKPENVISCLKKLSQTMEQFLAEPFDLDVFRKIQNAYVADQYFSAETISGLCRNYGSGYFSAKDEKYSEKFLKRVLKLKPEDLFKVFKKYVVIKKSVVSLSGPFNVKEATESKCESEINLFLKNLDTLSKSKLKKLLITHKSKNLIKPQKLGSETQKADLIRIKNLDFLFKKTNQSHLFSASLVTYGGGRLLLQEQAGLVELFSKTWLTDNKAYTEDELSLRLESLAASIYPTAGRNSVSLSMEGLYQFQKPISEIYKSILTGAQFKEHFVDRERSIQLQQIKNRNDQPAQTAIRKLVQSIFKSHPYGFDSLGSPETLASVKSESIHNYVKKLRSERSVFSVVGNIDIEFWKDFATQLAELGYSSKKEISKFEYTGPEKKIFYFEPADKEQSHLAIGWPSPGVFENRRATMQVVQGILAGQGGRLFLELRDKQSLAYTVSPVGFEGLEKGLFGLYIGCSTDKVDQALKGLLFEIDKLANDVLSEGELQRAKNYILGTEQLELQKISTVNSSLVYDLLYTNHYSENTSNEIRSVTVKQVQDLLKEILSQNATISLVGKKNFNS